MTPTATPVADPIPRWSLRDRDLWEDLFEAYSVALLGREEHSLADADRITRAAELADLAVKETRFRGWVQRRARVKKTTKRGTAKIRPGGKRRK